MHYVLGGVPVQIFPSTTMPLYRDTVESAAQFRIGGLRVNFASIEHLILLYLQAFRDKDQLRIRSLYRLADGAQLNELLHRFDDAEERLTRRLQELRGTSIPREGEVAPPAGQDELGPQA
jgi:predicted nucleotidyltransferase